jgi:hypothetical protein
MLVIGLGVLELLATTGCGYGYHRRYGYYRGGYGYYGAGSGATVVYNTQPPPQPVEGPPQQVVVQGQAQPGQVQVQVGAPQPPPPAMGEGIAGSDGTRGWRIAVQSPDREFQRLAQLAARANCQIESSTQSELKAMCNGNVHVVVRFDQANVYKLCAPNTDPNVCAQVWSSLN